MANWLARAACRDRDPELFSPPGETGPAERQIEEAKAVCNICPVKAECLHGAIAEGDDHTVRGGTTARERRGMRARARR
jgi:WhiB family redox-sensing transcriptional regulator